MSNYFDDDDIDDEALAAVLGQSIGSSTSLVCLPESTMLAQKKLENKIFQCEDDFNDEDLAAVLKDNNHSNGHESPMNPVSFNHSTAPTNHLTSCCNTNFDEERLLGIADRERVSSVPESTRHPAAVRVQPTQQTKIGHYFRPSPVDAEKVKSSILEFNTGAPTPLTTDVDTVCTLIYPINLPKRQYQVDCVESAVRENTLVVLPTGLGKTFIASVLLYNMLRWFPTGKCIFMAPTRQLVMQQAKACCEMSPIRQDSISIMLNIHPNARSSIWLERRLIFCTPQIVEKDIQHGRCPLQEIVCLVFDEAHHSVGNASMAGIVAKRFEINNRFRVLALSATPGSDRTQVQTIIDNLLIKRILAYNRKDPAIVKYVNYRQEEIIEIRQTVEIRNLLKMLDDICKKPAKTLENQGLLTLNFTMLGPGYFQGDAFMSRLREKRLQENWAILNSKLILQALLCARQYLCNYSISAFVTQLDHAFINSSNRALAHVSKDAAFTVVIQMAKDYSLRHVLHPKLQNLRNLIKMHFEAYPESRVIVFVEYKMIVDEIVNCIIDINGALPIRFVGQQKSTGAGDSVGMRPKEQSEAMEKFRSGEVNVLVATCIGEEGLDIGEVDLVIAYDTTSSALRTIQRMGRTARQRAGRCVSLIMEGNEMRNYESNLKNVQVSFRLLRSTSIKLSSIPCCIRPSHLQALLKFEHSSDITPWVSPIVNKKRSTAKHGSVELSSQESNELKQLWSLNEVELNGIQSRLLTSAEQVQEPLHRLVRGSEVSEVFTYIMELIAKVKLGHIEVESGNISLPRSASKCDVLPRPNASPKNRSENQSPLGSSWLLPESPTFDSDDELNELLEDIELLSQPNKARISDPYSSSSPTFGMVSLHSQSENLSTEEQSLDLEKSVKVPAKRPLPPISAIKATRKKSKVGAAGRPSIEKIGLRESWTQMLEIPHTIQQFYWQTSLGSEDRRNYIYFHLGCLQKFACRSSTHTRLRAPAASSESSSSLQSLVLPLSYRNHRNRLI